MLYVYRLVKKMFYGDVIIVIAYLLKGLIKESPLDFSWCKSNHFYSI